MASSEDGNAFSWPAAQDSINLRITADSLILEIETCVKSLRQDDQEQRLFEKRLSQQKCRLQAMKNSINQITAYADSIQIRGWEETSRIQGWCQSEHDERCKQQQDLLHELKNDVDILYQTFESYTIPWKMFAALDKHREKRHSLYEHGAKKINIVKDELKLSQLENEELKQRIQDYETIEQRQRELEEQFAESKTREFEAVTEISRLKNYQADIIAKSKLKDEQILQQQSRIINYRARWETLNKNFKTKCTELTTTKRESTGTIAALQGEVAALTEKGMQMRAKDGRVQAMFKEINKEFSNDEVTEQISNAGLLSSFMDLDEPTSISRPNASIGQHSRRSAMASISREMLSADQSMTPTPVTPLAPAQNTLNRGDLRPHVNPGKYFVSAHFRKKPVHMTRK
ncbi:hypothetical protein BJ875DRAFT_446414 [Amylocarpus encephaloides]|uniref:Uncharacterized protein n=1 Tax=Amylocarpus encephaloides TaxID=45428 RepID=A0A9P7Y977_9HELO|nr:hypothetical protein BJ875DRAFT_446414 [Amylocarpus encephaloides]